MKFIPTELPGVILVEPDVHSDHRGLFFEAFHAKKYSLGGIPFSFVQDNHIRSKQGTLRGLHVHKKMSQGKLVRVTRGEIFDVAVDVRRGSKTFKKWVGHVLSGENFLQMFIPPGFAHGFYVLSGEADVELKCTEFYDAANELAIRWNDPDIAIEWPGSGPLLSEKDARAPLLMNCMKELSLTI